MGGNATVRPKIVLYPAFYYKSRRRNVESALDCCWVIILNYFGFVFLFIASV